MNWTSLGNQYCCYQPIITPGGNLTHVLDITGNHTNGKTNADVKCFHLFSGHLQFNRIPMGIERFFSNLNGIRWSEGNLTSLNANDLKPFPGLEEIRFSNNKLISLDADLLIHTPKLRWIFFENILLENAGYGVLDSMYNLTNAYFGGNPCINMNAVMPEAIQILKQNLKDQCPPLITTTLPTTTILTTAEPENCSVGCVEMIDALKEEFARQKEENVRQAEAIQELEKQMREIWARP